MNLMTSHFLKFNSPQGGAPVATGNIIYTYKPKISITVPRYPDPGITFLLSHQVAIVLPT